MSCRLPALWTLCFALFLTGATSARAQAEESFLSQRNQMVDSLNRDHGVTGPVLDAMRAIPRHRFVPSDVRDRAYEHSPVQIGSNQTISHPYAVALMTSLLELDGDERVLEIGTGSGYQAAVLSAMAKEVYSIEILDELGRSARTTLRDLGYSNVHVRIGNGYNGWPEEAPFDAIIVTAAPPRVPQALIDQLKEGGRMVVPVGAYFQELRVISKDADGRVSSRGEKPVRFEPMIGGAESTDEPN